MFGHYGFYNYPPPPLTLKQTFKIIAANLSCVKDTLNQDRLYRNEYEFAKEQVDNLKMQLTQSYPKDPALKIRKTELLSQISELYKLIENINSENLPERSPTTCRIL